MRCLQEHPKGVLLGFSPPNLEPGLAGEKVRPCAHPPRGASRLGAEAGDSASRDLLCPKLGRVLPIAGGPTPAGLCKEKPNLRVPSGTSPRRGMTAARTLRRSADSLLADQCSDTQPEKLLHPTFSVRAPGPRSPDGGRRHPRRRAATFASLTCAPAGVGRCRSARKDWTTL